MGGRKKGSKNLQRDSKGNYINENGVKFTEKEKKQLEYLVNSANRKRNKMLMDESQLPLFVSGKQTGLTVDAMHKMGKESDFILAKKSKSLNRFKSKEEYKKYLKNLEKVTDRNYVEKKVEQYKKNHIKAVKNVFGKEGKEIVKKLKGMTTKEYMKHVQQDEVLEVGYIYEPQAWKNKLESIKDTLGIGRRK